MADLNLKYSSLVQDSQSFSSMMEQFAITTVMNARIYDTATVMGNTTFDAVTPEAGDNGNAVAIAKKFLATKPLCRLDTLKVANVTIDGPSKTVTGGQYANALVKYGKTGRLEMQDALGSARAIEALCGGVVEYNEATSTNIAALHYGTDFASTKTIVADTFFIDRKKGLQVPVTIIFYQFLPDSLFNLTQDAEGDATVFDMNGDLQVTDILISTKDGASESSTAVKATKHGLFYSIIDRQDETFAG